MKPYEKSIVCIITIRMANLSAFDLNLLRVLDALLDEKSTVRAGKRLGLSQPAVSAALGRLRIALGDELFFRRGQGMEPTAYAASLSQPLRDILEQVEAVIAGPAAFDPSRSTERFTVSGSDFFAELLMPKLADRLQEVAPSMLVHLVDLVPDSYVESVENTAVNLALIPRIAVPDWIETETLFRAQFCVIAKKGHPRLERAGINPGDVVPMDLFCDLGHVLFSPEGQRLAMGDAALAKVGRTRRVVMTMPVFSGVYRAVAGSDLIALLPASLARRIAPHVGLEIYWASIPIPTVEMMMVWHKRFSAKASHKWLRGQIADLLVDLDDPGPDLV